MRKYKPLFEDLTFNDLKKSVGMSTFTLRHRKIRNAKPAGQQESKVAKLIDAKVESNDVTFIFKTPATQNIYPNSHKYMKTDPNQSFDLHNNTKKLYTIEFKIIDFFKWVDTAPSEISVKDIEDTLEVAYIKLFCNCGSFHWQGSNYNLSVNNASIYPTNIPPDHWNDYHNADQYVCKHVGGIINSIKFFIPQMRQKIIKKVRKSLPR